jgi:uncharacterized membrane protein
MTEQIHRAKINKSNYRTNTQSEDKQIKWQNRLVYLHSVYLFCHLTCLSSFCVFVLSFDLCIFALCICSVKIHRTKINKSNDRTNTQSEDKQIKWQNKYTERRYIWLVYLRSVYLFCNLTCLSSFCVFGLSFDLFIFVLCEDKQVEWQTKYTERR